MNDRHRRKRLALLHYMLAMPRSIWYNFRKFPPSTAIHLPLLISHRTVVEDLSGKLHLTSPHRKVGLVKIGFNTYQQSDFRYCRTRLNVRGQWTIEGECAIGAGSTIEIAEAGLLTTGNYFNMGPEDLLICHRNISFGAHVLTSWRCTFMDTDQHTIIDDTGEQANPDKPIVVGNNVWIGCHVIVAKGTTLPDDVIVGAGSIVHGTHNEPRCVLAGNPAHIVRRNVSWQ